MIDTTCFTKIGMSAAQATESLYKLSNVLNGIKIQPDSTIAIGSSDSTIGINGEVEFIGIGTMKEIDNRISTSEYEINSLCSRTQEVQSIIDMLLERIEMLEANYYHLQTQLDELRSVSVTKTEIPNQKSDLEFFNRKDTNEDFITFNFNDYIFS